jgi:hypothetical protein
VLFVFFLESNVDFYKENDSNTFYSRLQNTKWLKNVSTLMGLTTRLLDCVHIHQRNTFLEERKHNMDCSCLLASLLKICMNAKYRTIVGLENLIQKEWFLNGHMFAKRLQAPLINLDESFVLQNGDDAGAATLARRNSSASMLSSAAVDATANTTNTLSSNVNSSSAKYRDMAPTFLLFLDCLFQLTVQYPAEFEFSEYYLINLWDYAISGLSFTYCFNGPRSWLKYLNDQTFMNSDSSSLNAAASAMSAGNNSVMPKFENAYLKQIFDNNIAVWLRHLSGNKNETKIKIHFLNKQYSKTNSILYPNDKLYLLRFWSRCYLRWIERCHPYNNNASCVEKAFSPDYSRNSSTSNSSSQPPNYDPPPPPPPQLPTPIADNNGQTLKSPSIVIQMSVGENDAKVDHDVENEKAKNLLNANNFKVITKVTPDGNIESSF